MAKVHKMSGPGRIVNRAAKNGKLEITFDPSPKGFVSEAKRDKARLTVLVLPGDGEMDPIEITATAKTWKFIFHDAAVPADRLAELEQLITEESDVHIALSYRPDQETIDFEADQDRA